MALANPFQRILKLSVGDFVSKALYFLAFVYLARVLGVRAYGVVEFANSIMVYLLLIGEAGLDRWGMRAAAQTSDARSLAGQFVPLRFFLAVAAFVMLLGFLPLLPPFPQLKAVLIIFGCMLFTQAWNLKWVFIGRQEMARVGIGLAMYQAVFASSVFWLVKDDSGVVWVAVLRLVSEFLLAGYFAVMFASRIGSIRFSFSLEKVKDQLRPAATMGAAQFLSLVSYNFDAVLIGFLMSELHVGWYGAAYKPVTVALAIPLTYFLGYYSVLSKTFAQSVDEFQQLVRRSLALTSIFAVPLGVGACLLAAPILRLLYGRAYDPAIPVLQVLAWSAVLVILRGNFRHALHAAGKQDIDLRYSLLATGTNILLNILWIPRMGMIGAAWATVVAEILWLFLSWSGYRQTIGPTNLLRPLWRPFVAGSVMAAYLWYGWPEFWVARGIIASVVYFVTLWAMGDPEVRTWPSLFLRRAIPSAQND